MFYNALNVQPSLWQLVLVRYRTRGRLLFSLLRLTRRDIKKQKTKNNNIQNQKNKKQKNSNNKQNQKKTKNKKRGIYVT
jgi:coenzyme F420-reducing hydrogenase beta subunit